MYIYVVCVCDYVWVNIYVCVVKVCMRVCGCVCLCVIMCRSELVNTWRYWERGTHRA